MGWDLHTIFVPIYGSKIGLSAAQIGMILASFAAATFVVRLAMLPWIARAGNEATMLMAALVCGGAVFLAFPFLTSALALASLSFVLGFALGSGQPIVLSLLHANAPPGRVGETVGMRMSLMQSMAVAVPLVFGALGDRRPAAGVLVGGPVPGGRGLLRAAERVTRPRGCARAAEIVPG